MKINCHIKIISIIILLFSFNSCRTTKSDRNYNLRPVYVTNTKKINLLLPSNISIVKDGLQLFNGTFGDKCFSMMSYTQIDESGISLSLINDFGTDMGNLFFDGNQVSFDSAYLPSKLPGEYIVAEIQNAYYDEDILQKNYSSAGLRFEVQSKPDERENESVEIRKIYDGKKLIEEIYISEEKVNIINYLRGYSFELINVE